MIDQPSYGRSTVSDMHQNEYNDNMTTVLEIIWGKGFMAPGGEGNVHRIVEGLDLKNKSVLEIGSGIGGGSMVLAEQYGARVIGLEVEESLVDKARAYASAANLADKVEFRLIQPGPLGLDDASVDIVYTSGVLIHIEDKSAMFNEVLRVLKPGGVLTGYDWLKGPAALSEAMHEWIELEELTFYMATLEEYAEMMTSSGFNGIRTSDSSQWYAAEAQHEREKMAGPLYEKIASLVGEETRDHFLADWAATVGVLNSGELRNGYFRGFKPAI